MVEDDVAQPHQDVGGEGGGAPGLGRVGRQPLPACLPATPTRGGGGPATRQGECECLAPARRHGALSHPAASPTATPARSAGSTAAPADGASSKCSPSFPFGEVYGGGARTWQKIMLPPGRVLASAGSAPPLPHAA